MKANREVAWVSLGDVLVFCLLLSGRALYGQAEVRIMTPLPNLYADWKIVALSSTASDADARAYAEHERVRVQALKDPFTPLGPMTCAQRAAKRPPEFVVWEDLAPDGFMALVDFGDRGSTLLLTPKTAANFLIDLSPAQLARLNRLAGATCDALMVAALEKPSSTTPSCRMFVNPPAALSVGHLHVHVEAQTAVSPPASEDFLKRAGAHMRILAGGRGCF